MEILCVLFVVLLAVTVVGHGLWLAVAAVLKALFGGEQEVGDREFCVGCNASNDRGYRVCWRCGLDRADPVAVELADLKATARQLRRWLEDKSLDESTFERLYGETQAYRRRLGFPVPARAPAQPRPTAPAPSPATIPIAEPIPEALPVEAPIPAVAETPGTSWQQLEESGPLAQPEVAATETIPAPPPPPRRSFVELLAGFMEERQSATRIDHGRILSVPHIRGIGLPAEERRDIEGGLRSGKYRVVFSTNALEIGIDIGQLDCCILAGFPDNVMSAWQRIGRTGRSWDKTAYVLFYAMNSAIDQFFASNIDAFLDKPLDEIIVGVDNEELIGKHIRYLLHESSWRVEELRKEILGEYLWQCAKAKAESGGPIAGQKPPYLQLDIRGASGVQSTLTCNAKEIGTISDVHLFREAYVGAIYNHRGETYRVTAHGAREVFLEKAEPYLRTDPRFFTNVQNSEIIDAVRHKASIGICYGKVIIYDNFTGYRLIDERSEKVIDEVARTAAIRKPVRGFWLTVENPALFETSDVEAGMHVVEQFLRIGSPFIIPCDRHDVATLASMNAVPTAYLYETVPGGIGIAEKMLEVGEASSRKAWR